MGEVVICLYQTCSLIEPLFIVGSYILVHCFIFLNMENQLLYGKENFIGAAIYSFPPFIGMRIRENAVKSYSTIFVLNYRSRVGMTINDLGRPCFGRLTFLNNLLLRIATRKVLARTSGSSKYAVLRSTPPKSVSLTSARSRCVSVRLAPSSNALLKSVSSKCALLRFVVRKSKFFRQTLQRSAPSKFASCKLTSSKWAHNESQLEWSLKTAFLRCAFCKLVFQRKFCPN